MIGIKRIQKEYRDLLKEPVNNFIAKPFDDNIYDWRFIFKGEKDTVYEGGIYMGKLTLPKEYPWKPPRIQMITPNGRFSHTKPLCLSFSHYHPESWNPALNIRTMLVSMISFFYDSIHTTGGLKTDDETKRNLASSSIEYNKTQNDYMLLFPDNELESKPKPKTVIIKRKKK